MYLDHFGLKRQPFSLTADPAFLWTGEKQRDALELLKSGILLNRGFVVLTGEVGTGKTTLVAAFSGLNEIATITVTVPDPGMEALDFLNFVAREFGMGREFSGRDEFVRHFKSFLLNSYAAYKKVLIVIDEAQRLNHELLAVIAQLAAIELAGRRMLKIFFIGQIEFNDMLMEDKNAAVREEVVAAYNLEPLAAGETFQFIAHRLAVAGTKKKLFTPQAMMLIHNL
ncbi:MAG TPA: AAA family ATPase, partial [Desulfosarcina sp.]|nr:AAA family ATPase [Desulfosarcina sp.]